MQIYTLLSGTGIQSASKNLLVPEILMTEKRATYKNNQVRAV